MNPQLVFQILGKNGVDLLAIEQKVGGLGGILKLLPHIEALYGLFAAGGIGAVLEKGGPEIQAVINGIGVDNIAAVLPYAANILKTVQGK